ncbi:MAG TPA: hypothetical protein PKK66_01740 [Bacteroidales bacterium]|nr:hypothetical protein [Bacteroidales bacterium]HPT52314.1 hypothetical protein [Bacteroidales bacterium]
MDKDTFFENKLQNILFAFSFYEIKLQSILEVYDLVFYKIMIYDI